MANDWIEKNGKIWITKKIFKNQPLPLNNMTTYSGSDPVDLVNITTVTWKYEKPDQTRGTFTNAGSVDSPTTNGTVSGTIDANELDQVGGENRPWKIWAVLADSNGSYPGTIFYLPVHEEGTA